MTFGQPTILRKSVKKKQEILNAVEDLMAIIAEKLHEADQERYDELANLPGAVRSLSFSFNFIHTGSKFIVGRTQQRYLKRFERQWRIRATATKIAQETGVPVEQIEEDFFIMLHKYIHR